MSDKKNLICGFGFFVGDCVILNRDKVGNIQWIDLERELISVRFKIKGGINAYSVVSPDKVKKIASKRKGVSTLFSAIEIKEIYDEMSVDEKCFFHYNDSKNIEEIAKELSIPIEQVEKALERKQ